VGENVYGLVNWNGGLVFNEVQTDLEAEGYEVQPVILPACAVNAPHRRDRVWFVAHSLNGRYKTRREEKKGTNRVQKISREGSWWIKTPDLMHSFSNLFTGNYPTTPSQVPDNDWEVIGNIHQEKAK